MLSALCIADLATANIRNNPFGNNDIWPLLEKDIRIGPWTWAGHIALADWVLHLSNLPRYYHATNFPEYTPRLYPDSITLRTISKDQIRAGFGVYGGHAMGFGSAIKVPLHGPVPITRVVVAGTTSTVVLTASEGVPPYTYRLPDDAPSWMRLVGSAILLAPPLKLDSQSGVTTAIIMDDEAQEVEAQITWAVTAAPPTG